MTELPSDWFIDHDGQSRVLDPEKVRAEIERLRAALEEIASDPTGISIAQAEIAKRALDEQKAGDTNAG